MALPSFLTKHGSVSLLNKQKNLFDILNAVEKELKPGDGSRCENSDEFMEIEPKTRKRKRRGTKQFRGKESLFKEPIDVALKFKAHKVPDFQRNPGKWIKYSLADITQEDMSNETNIATALSFLQEMKALKAQKELACMSKEPDDECDCKPAPSNSHKFHLPLKEENAKTEPVVADKIPCKPTFKSSKLIMPEYVVGQVKRERCGKKVVKEKGKEIYLSHIHEYNDE